MKNAPNSFLWLTLVLLLSSSTAFAAPPIAVSTNTCLFLDDYFISEQSGFTRTFHQGKPHPTAIVAETEPWDHWICLYGDCFYDPVGKVYRMYYQTSHYPSGVPGLSFRQDTAYAESKDAIHWIKPKLGFVDFNGSKENNLLFHNAGAGNVFLDPKATDPKGRIKATLYFCQSDPRFGVGDVLHDQQVLQSADGVHWEYVGPFEKPKFANPEQGGFIDAVTVSGWDLLKQKYLANSRCYSTHSIGEFPAAGESFEPTTKRVRRRAIGISWSDNPQKGWSPTVMIVAADEQDDKRAAEKFAKDPTKPTWTELYGMPMNVYGNHYIGFIVLFDRVDKQDGNGGGGLQFAFSNDGLNWTRPEPRQNAVENSDDPELWPNFAQFGAPLDMGNEIWVFYSENNGTHGVQPFIKSRGRIRAAVWRKDGFASLDAAGKATLVTKPLATTGSKLLLNFNTEKDGYVRVGVLDAEGNPISQFNLGECQDLKGNATAKEVVWGGGSDFSDRAGGKPVRLMFELNKAHLWSFRFAP